MSNTNKILITIVSCVFMICVASVSIVSIVSSNEKETTTTTDVPPSQYVEQTQGTTDAASVSGQTQSNLQTTTSQPQSGASATTTNPSVDSSTTTAVTTTGDLAADILGKWTDSAGMSGYEFLEGGKFSWTYVDLEGFGVPFNGKTSGVYTLEGDTLTVKFSIYTATIQKTYRVSITQNELSMFDLEERETSTYVRES